MDINELSLARQSHAMAILAKAAYLDNCLKIFSYWDVATDYRFLSNDDAQAHIGCNDKCIVIAFRGTEFTKLEDLLADAKIWPKTHGVGWVHAGFRSSARKLMTPIMNFVSSHPGRRIHITGHSMGAAMGLYMAQELHWAGHDDIVLFSYGSPRMGNRKYVKSIPLVHHRFVNCNDMIPGLPWMFLGYRHHGTMHYISANGKICKPTSWRRFTDSIISKLQAWSHFKLLDGLADHNIMRYIEKLDKVTEM